MATITPPAAESAPAELALLDRRTNVQLLITPAHNSFDQTFSKIYANKVWGSILMLAWSFQLLDTHHRCAPLPQ
jgi:hypothetical protein